MICKINLWHENDFVTWKCFAKWFCDMKMILEAKNVFENSFWVQKKTRGSCVMAQFVVSQP